MTTDLDRLLASVAADPADDVRRLALADWAQEHDRPDVEREQRLAVALRRVLAAPADDAPRLAYADVCEQFGDSDRAAFVREQIAVAQLEDWRGPMAGARFAGFLSAMHANHAALRAMLDDADGPCPCEWCARKRVDRLETPANHMKWRGPTCRAIGACSFRRGFVDLVVTTWSDWFARGDRALREQPITRVVLSSPSTMPLDQLTQRWPGVEFRCDVAIVPHIVRTVTVPRPLWPTPAAFRALMRLNSEPFAGFRPGELMLADWRTEETAGSLDLVEVTFRFVPSTSNRVVPAQWQPEVFGTADFNELFAPPAREVILAGDPLWWSEEDQAFRAFNRHIDHLNESIFFGIAETGRDHPPARMEFGPVPPDVLGPVTRNPENRPDA